MLGKGIVGTSCVHIDGAWIVARRVTDIIVAVCVVALESSRPDTSGLERQAQMGGETKSGTENKRKSEI